MHIGIVSRCDLNDAIKLAADIAQHLNERATIVYDECTGRKLGFDGIPLNQMDTDVIVAVGGDGTILRILQDLDHPIPIIGINVGKVGFLADVSPSNALSVVDNLLSGFRVSAHSRLSISLNDKRLPPATNEAVIMTSKPGHLLEYSVEVDDRVLDTLRADGVIVATSTGSTAYAMSAGGPIIDPRVDAFIIVALAPYKLSVRPWVVFGESTIKVRIVENDAVIIVDGQHSEAVHETDTIVFRKDKEKALFVIADKSFFEKVMSKLR